MKNSTMNIETVLPLIVHRCCGCCCCCGNFFDTCMSNIRGSAAPNSKYTSITLIYRRTTKEGSSSMYCDVWCAVVCGGGWKHDFVQKRKNRFPPPSTRQALHDNLEREVSLIRYSFPPYETVQLFVSGIPVRPSFRIFVFETYINQKI